MKTQLEKAKAGIITPEMEAAAAHEGVDSSRICQLLARGLAVLPKNIKRDFREIRSIGQGLKTKVNANLGTSGVLADQGLEKKKLNQALRAGTDSIMDLSTGGDLTRIREMFLEQSPVMVGSVPIYGLAAKMVHQGRPLSRMDSDILFREIEEQCRQGVDYITVHCGITSRSLEMLERSERIMPCVSRGGSIHMNWIKKNKKENPLFENFDTLLEIAGSYDVTLSLGDGLRPGCIADALDQAQVDELMTLAHLARRAYEKGVQVMIEGPGHVPLGQISSQIKLQKRLCNDAPFYVLGPLPTDIAAGYDHITAAIGGALAGAAGADFLCYVTPAEHLGLPDEDDVYQGVMACRVAGHIADIEKGVAGALEQDMKISKCRQALDWEGIISNSLDPDLVRKRLQITDDEKGCSMCGKLCAVSCEEKM
ncbi:phosphomethylpyrimidine synthase ThiC [Desulfonatronovibrio hydrogenovorans]|uniref:phosphomethylpyrimidine synthase ThiC n=1 Tax=Desulfonatronovibrio hydrogenovorans TaxID=53245 RepID=UPI00048ADDB5|nr:phosphomethylpyrimidine synthase ThiC [Desulfonatronovibrio hydrogenovorans]